MIRQRARRTSPRPAARRSGRRHSACLLAGLALALTAVGCGGSDDDTGQEPGDGNGGASADSTTVTVWSWRTEDEAAMTEIFDQFEADNPGITVEVTYIPDADYQNKLGIALRGGEGPDIAQLKAYGELQPLVDAGYLTPLDDLVPELTELSQDALDGAKSRKDGKYYGVPYSVVNMGVFYNKDVFDENGIDIPTSYDEFVAACDKLKSAGVTPIAAGGAGGTGWALEINAGVIGPNVYGPDFYDEMMSGEATFTDPRFVKVLQTIKDLAPYYQDGFAGTDYTAAVQMFVNGKAAMFFGGSYENGSFAAQNPDLNFSVFPFPSMTGDGPAYTSSFSDGSYGLVGTTEHQDAAVKVLRFMASEQFAQLFADKLGWPPAREGISPEDPVLQEMTTMQEHSEPYVTLVGFRWNTPTASSILQSGIVDVITGKKAPDALAEEMADGVATWFEPTE